MTDAEAMALLAEADEEVQRQLVNQMTVQRALDYDVKFEA
jgi:hypothetical protein